MGDTLKDIKRLEQLKGPGETLLPPIERRKTKHAERKSRLKQLRIKDKEKKERRQERKEKGEAPLVPKTIDSTREPDSTILQEIDEETAEEIKCDLETDELNTYFKQEVSPKVLITFSENPIKASRRFALFLKRIIPNSMMVGRKGSSVKKMIDDAKIRGFTDIIIINEDRFAPNGLLLIHLPDGPTAYFRLSSVKVCNKRQAKEITDHRPEVILSNFTTRLGQTVGRMLGAIFHYNPQFRGRRVVTFHNQRDYIFFRHHRYKFVRSKAALRELGPRFTLKLQSIQKGVFDSLTGDYEFNIFGKRHQMEKNRRTFVL